MILHECKAVQLERLPSGLEQPAEVFKIICTEPVTEPDKVGYYTNWVIITQGTVQSS